MSHRRTGWTVAVLGAHEVHLAAPERYERVPVRHYAYRDAAYTLDRAAELFRGNPHGAGTLLVDAHGLVEEWRGQAARGEGIGAGLTVGAWSCRSVEPWTTWRRGDAPVVHVGVLGRVPVEKTPLGSSQAEHGDMARRLAWYAQAVGAPYALTPGIAGHMAIRHAQSRRGRGGQPYWGVRDLSLSAERSTGAGDLIWRRAPLRTEVDAGWVHGFDLNAARLAAMGVAELAYGRLRHTGAVGFEASEAGYWLIHAADVRQHPRHAPHFEAGNGDGTVWLTTPIMADLLALGISPAVGDSWTSPGRRILRATAERWNAARLAAMGHGDRHRLDAVKSTYREAAGLFAHAGGSIDRADWYHTIMDRQRVTVLGHIRRIAKAHERRPLAVHTDCLWYASSLPDWREAAAELGIRIGHELGTFRHHSTARAAEYFKPKGAS